MRDDIAAFVLSHGRADNVTTIRSFRNAGWTHPIYIVVDNEDPTADEYRQRFGADNVFEFDKPAIAETFDTADTQNDRRAIVYARNACWEIARTLGLRYFVELDDDYVSYRHRFIRDGVIGSTMIRNIEPVVDAMCELLDTTGAATVAMSQGGDHIGGIYGPIRKAVKRKAMNFFVMRTDRPFTFVGRINEDVNTYVTLGMRGELFLTLLTLQFDQHATQSSSGGMTDVYLNSGTYTKSFYTVMMAPSCVKVGTMGRTDRRFHHIVDWDRAVPKIISDRYRKAAA